MEVVTGKPIFETITPEEEEDAVFSYPYAFFREAIALMVTVTGIMAISLFFHAPLEELANPAKTPNPAKAPWYFLGLQELVSHSALAGRRGCAGPDGAGAARDSLLRQESQPPSRRPQVGPLALHLLRCRQPGSDRHRNFLPRSWLGVGSTVGTCCCGGRVMGRRLPQFFFALSMLALVLIVAAVWQASTPSWKNYQRDFFQLEAQGEPNAVTKAAVLATPPQIHQILLPGLQRVDRCTTCHLGVDDPTMKNAPEPFRYHAGLGPHIPSKFGCTICHGGQGLATDMKDAHGNVQFWQTPLLASGLHSRFLRPMPQGRRCSRRAGTDRGPAPV